MDNLLLSTNPTTERKKDPRRQAAGRAAAEKTRLAREAQKKELEDSKAELSKYGEKEAAAAASPTSGQEAASDDSKAENSFSFGTVLALGGLIIGAASLYYQRKATQACAAEERGDQENGLISIEDLQHLYIAMCFKCIRDHKNKTILLLSMPSQLIPSFLLYLLGFYVFFNKTSPPDLNWRIWKMKMNILTTCQLIKANFILKKKNGKKEGT